MFWSSPVVMASIAGYVTGKPAGGGGSKITCPLLSVVGIVLRLVSRGEDCVSCDPAGLGNVLDNPNAPPELSKLFTSSCPARSYVIPKPPRMDVFPLPNNELSKPSPL